MPCKVYWIIWMIFQIFYFNYIQTCVYVTSYAPAIHNNMIYLFSYHYGHRGQSDAGKRVFLGIRNIVRESSCKNSSNLNHGTYTLLRQYHDLFALTSHYGYREVSPMIEILRINIDIAYRAKIAVSKTLVLST